MQPTIVVVNAELYCVQSTVEYIRTNLQNKCISVFLISQHMESNFTNNYMQNHRQRGSESSLWPINFSTFPPVTQQQYHWTSTLPGCSVLTHKLELRLTPWYRRGQTGWGKAHLTSLHIPRPDRTHTQWEKRHVLVQDKCELKMVRLQESHKTSQITAKALRSCYF